MARKGTRIATWNVNGLRSAVRGEFEHWLRSSNIDIACLQEAKVEEDLLTRRWFDGFDAHWNPAARAGYSGVATLVGDGIDICGIERGIGDPETDVEGRVIATRFRDFELVNVYAPHSHRTLSRLGHKLRFLAKLDEYIARKRATSPPLIIVGDLNVAHLDIDVANAKANKGNAGFLPQERAWLDNLLRVGFLDAFRLFDSAAGNFTWWSMRTGVRERNVGWRLDYIIVDARLKARLTNCRIQRDQRGSDHCPVVLDLD